MFNVKFLGGEFKTVIMWKDVLAKRYIHAEVLGGKVSGFLQKKYVYVRHTHIHPCDKPNGKLFLIIFED